MEVQDMKNSSGGRDTLNVTRLLITVNKKMESLKFVFLSEHLTKIALFFLKKEKFLIFLILISGKPTKERQE